MKKAPKKRRSAPRVLNFRVSSRAEQVERAEPGDPTSTGAISDLFPVAPSGGERASDRPWGAQKTIEKAANSESAGAGHGIARRRRPLPARTHRATQRRRACPLTAAASADRYRSAYRGLPWVSVRPIGDGS